LYSTGSGAAAELNIQSLQQPLKKKTLNLAGGELFSTRCATVSFRKTARQKFLEQISDYQFIKERVLSLIS
jgi:hypothetical protein